MSEEIKQFDINDAVRQKVRAIFADIIPDDVLDTYMQKEIKNFFHDDVKVDRWDNKTITKSEFSVLVKQYVNEYLKEKLPVAIQQNTQKLLDEVGKDGLSDLIGKAQARYASEFQSKLVESLSNLLPTTIQNVVSQMKQEGRL